MAKKNKEARVQVILECTEMKESGMPGTSRYITTKNRKNSPERLELLSLQRLVLTFSMRRLFTTMTLRTISLRSNSLF